MLRSLRHTEDFKIHAKSEPAGTVHDFLFEDDAWHVRHLVVDTGHWLPGRKVLLFVGNIESIDWMEQIVHVPLEREAIKHAPGLDTDKPISRQLEEQLFSYYRWVPYWLPYNVGLSESVAPVVVEVPEPPEEHGDPHLQSFNAVDKYAVMGEERQLGYLHDMIFCDNDWSIDSIVLNTEKWLREKRVRIGVERVNMIDCHSRQIHVSVRTREVEDASAFNFTALIKDQLDGKDVSDLGRLG